MGLDMYLTKRTYVGAEYDFRGATGTIDIKINGKPLPINFNRVTYIYEEVMYWRKANHIHKWFVDNVQDGEDNCAQYHVSVDQLRELAKTCKEVIDNKEKAQELLPAQSGFFFGGTSYDSYYYDETKRTYKGIKKLLRELKDSENFDIDFIYQSSW